MKRIAVIGLGIIGGSICADLKRANYAVDGTSRRRETVDCAKEFNYIDGEVHNLKDYDVVILALPPKVTIEYLTEKEYKDGALVADICGVKKALEDAVYAKKRNYRYIGLHPMAGKETSGLKSATPDLFVGANLIITLAEKTKQSAIDQAKELALALGFGKIVECSAVEHDKKIAITSQLAHIVSNAYVNSEEAKDCDGFTGGSFQDMTRIAGVDEKMWTELYLLNRDAILSELEGLIEHLSVYKDALKEKDGEKLSETLKEGRLIRETSIRLPKRKK
ncbi:MAG: prephenate dehydrogenase/arogenate dehydrogenase family protein [Clostridia bacterium]|nr:prephenate dehydrogenase/arogenate dehydrogenase family protein [Clostridia bacterium]